MIKNTISFKVSNMLVLEFYLHMIFLSLEFLNISLKILIMPIVSFHFFVDLEEMKNISGLMYPVLTGQ